MKELVIEKIIIPITECISGMTLMQSIIDEHTGTVIVARGQTLTEENIEKLKNFEHTQVWIALQTESTIWKVEPKKIEKYKSYEKTLKVIMRGHEKAPISIKELEEIADDMLKEFVDDYEILACVNLSSQLDTETFCHSVNVAFLSLLMGRWLKYEPHKLKNLILAALLHDVGKISLSTLLKHKSEDQMDYMEKLEYRRHTVYGYERLVTYNEVDVEVLKGVLSHHERCDGSGYPLSLRENKINDLAKIIGIADTYDCLKQQYHIFEVIRHLGNLMIRKFDVNLLLEFCHNLTHYYIGCAVLLNTGEIGEVAFIQSQALSRPILKVKDEYVNLYESTHLEIVKVL